MVFYRYCIAIALILSCSSNTHGQAINQTTYKTAIGLRAGETSGISFKQKLNDFSSFEGILGLWSNAIGFTILYEKNTPAFDVEGLDWYYGGGGHFIFSTNSRVIGGERSYFGSDLAIGVDGVVGLDYKIPPIPFAVSLDLKPFLEIDTDGGVVVLADPGIGIKFTF